MTAAMAGTKINQIDEEFTKWRKPKVELSKLAKFFNHSATQKMRNKTTKMCDSKEIVSKSTI